MREKSRDNSLKLHKQMFQKGSASDLITRAECNKRFDKLEKMIREQMVFGQDEIGQVQNDEVLTEKGDNQYVRYLMRHLKFSEEDKKYIEDIKKEEQNYSINQLLAKKIEVMIYTNPRESIRVCKWIFKSFYECSNNYFDSSLSFIEFIVLILSKYDFQDKKEQYKEVVNPFVDKYKKDFESFS